MCNPRFVICFLIAWVITNGWGYLFIILGSCFKNTALLAIGSSYIAFLWVPCTPEKVLTITIALILQKKLFPNHISDSLKEIQTDENIVIQSK
jgi:hypothetical protein